MRKHMPRLLSVALLCGTSSSALAASAPDRPAWVSRGSAAVTAEVGRAVYGVGMAHPGPEARAQVLSEARDGLLQQIDALAAAVQKDPSPNAALVAGRLKASRKELADLARRSDQYLAADGSQFVMLAVSANTLMATVGLTPTAFDALFDKAARVEEPSPTIMGESDTSHGDNAPDQDVQKVTVEQGPEPVWIKGTTSPNLPSSVFICGRGEGSSQASAIGAGASVINHLLKGPVQTASNDFQAALGPAGLSSVHGKSVDDVTNATLDIIKPLNLGRLLWANEKGRWFAATCLERSAVYGAISDKFKALDTDLHKALAAAVAAPEGTKNDSLTAALIALQQRSAAAAVLRVVNFNGIADDGATLLADVVTAQNPATGAARTLAVAADGPYSLGFGNAVVSGLAGHGTSPSLAQVLPKPDLRLTAKLSFVEPEGAHDATGNVALELQDVRSGKTLYTGKLTAKGNAPANVYDAERASIADLAKQAVSAVEKGIASAP